MKNIFWISKYSPNNVHFLQNVQSLLYDELLLQNIPGKVTIIYLIYNLIQSKMILSLGYLKLL